MGLKVGMKWGAVECTDSYMRLVKKQVGNMDRTEEIHHYELTCECGKRKQIVASEFKGKRLTQDCGCGIATQGVSEVLTVTVPRGLKAELRARAKQEQTNLSHMTAKMLRQGLKQERVETK